MQALPDAAESLCIAEMGGTEERDGEPGVKGSLYLNIGRTSIIPQKPHVTCAKFEFKSIYFFVREFLFGEKRVFEIVKASYFPLIY